MAMNGIEYGTSNSGSSCFWASETKGRGSVEWPKPVPNPSPAQPCAASRLTKARWAGAVSSCRPVLRISSPPESHGVGSGNSVL